MEEKKRLNKKWMIGGSIALAAAVATTVTALVLLRPGRVSNAILMNINLDTMTDGDGNDLKKYTESDYESFLSDYKNGKLPAAYVTEFLFDGAGMYKTYDLDDYIEKGNDVTVKTLSSTILNLDTSGTVELAGEFTGMVAINTNNLDDDLKVVLNGVSIDTDSKKIPAIYVYNKDILYDVHKVTISAKEGTTNTIEGGKLKKVSLIDSASLDEFSSKYSGDAKEWYSEYTNYYGVYSAAELDKVLFAKATADSDDLKEGDPYYFYKAAGAISSDIDLYFEGAGELKVVSKNKEGIETKGNLAFTGGTGDYTILAEDDCLNTTTKSSGRTSNSSTRNALYINVNSLTAIVSLEADEGDAIDSNGTLTIDGGKIIALAKPGADAGLDSETGTYINGGTVIATGNMYDAINSDSKQKVVALTFGEGVKADETIALLDSNGSAVFTYTTDRAYTNLVYSSAKLADGDYTLYKGGKVTGEAKNGFVENVTNYDKSSATQLGYASAGNNGRGGFGGFNGGERPEMPSGERPEMPEGFNGGERPELPEGFDGKMPESFDGERPEMPEDFDGEWPGGVAGERPEGKPGEGTTNAKATNGTFSINSTVNLFSGVGALAKE